MDVRCPGSQVISDLKDECGKHGEVVTVIVPRPADPSQVASLFGNYNYGKVRLTLLSRTCLCHQKEQCFNEHSPPQEFVPGGVT